MAAQKLRCQQLLQEGTASALEEAVNAAHSCLELDKTQVRGYLLLTEALTRLRRHEDAVVWYKKGLKLHPDNAELLAGLKEARVAVLNDLLEDSEEDDGEEGILATHEQLEQRNTSEIYIESLRGVQATTESGALRSTQIVQRAQVYATSGLDEVLTSNSKDTAVQDSNETQTTVFQTKMERILEHLDLLKLARMAAVYIF
ncbi:hypothetical protein L917_10832 [Phytophthora nicotianae]|nr:hypothetical protein L917_10832 [Phytophthora nicotianae]